MAYRSWIDFRYNNKKAFDFSIYSHQKNTSKYCKDSFSINKIKMTIHNLYIFSKNGMLLYYTEWNRNNKSSMTKEEVIKTYI